MSGREREAETAGGGKAGKERGKMGTDTGRSEAEKKAGGTRAVLTGAERLQATEASGSSRLRPSPTS